MAKHLEPVIRWAERTKRSKADIAAAMTKAMAKDGVGINVHRNEVTEWLHPDPDRRIPPLLGTGLVLIKVGRKLAGLKPAVILLVACFALISVASAGSKTPRSGKESGSRTASGRPGHLLNQPPRPADQPEPRLAPASLGLAAVTAVLGIQCGIIHNACRRNRR